VRIIGISSGGGHLTELVTIARFLPTLSAVITETGAAERNTGSDISFMPIRDPHRSIFGFLRNLGQAFRYAQRHKPDVVISTGAVFPVGEDGRRGVHLRGNWRADLNALHDRPDPLSVQLAVHRSERRLAVLLSQSGCGQHSLTLFRTHHSGKLPFGAVKVQATKPTRQNMRRALSASCDTSSIPQIELPCSIIIWT
jgi:hypothetical protein